METSVSQAYSWQVAWPYLSAKRKLAFITENDYFITKNTNNILFRNFGLALSYSFGRLKENVSKKKGVNNDDQVQ